jgi:hypothetical protein
MPVPVAVSQLKAKKTGSVRGVGTTGGTRWTMLWMAGTWMSILVSGSSHVLVIGRPHANTRTLRMIQGSQARMIRSDAGLAAVASAVSPSSRQIRAGFQTRRNSVRQAIDTTAATTSTSHGP